MALLAQVSTQQLITKSISTLTLNVSSITGVVLGAVSPADVTSSIQGLASIGYISTSQLTSTVASLASGSGSGFTGSTTFLSSATINASTIFTNSIFVSSIQSVSSLTSSLTVNGTGVLKANGTNSASLYGAGVDTLTLQTSCNAYLGGIASMAFATNKAAYPLGRIYALDSAASGSPISQLIFQTVPSSATSFTSNYSYTGSGQTFTVPAGVTTIQVSLWGAGGGGGGGGAGSYGGAGAFVQGTLSVSPGQVYTIVVGQGGPFGTVGAAYGGGGASGAGGYSQGSGGGRSAIQLNLNSVISSASGTGSAITYNTNVPHGLVINQPVIISGLSPSGFNGTYVVSSTPTTTQFVVSSGQSGSSTGTGSILAEVINVGGGGGGALNYYGGYAAFSGSSAPGTGLGPGGGGTQSSGGAAGSYLGQSGQAGSLLQGGAGYYNSGAGGGGYYGGGGGPGNSSGGGGGGSSYTSHTSFALTLGLNSPNLQEQAPGTSVGGYVTGVAKGGTSGVGGSGYVILNSIGGSITEAMRIGSNSYVGIATTTPSYPLDVGGNARMSNVYLGTNSTLITQQFYGLFGAYNNTVLAEISTGGGTQELLVFKGSSASDRVRVQTTGTFVVETGVSARLWSTNTAITASNATPAFIVNSSSNVGIQTASPGATLDVAGTGRFQTLSTFALNLSSINGAQYALGLTTSNLQSTVGGLGQIYLSTGGAGTGDVTTAQLRSTVGGLGQIYLSTASGGGSSGPIPFISAFTVSTGSINTSSFFAMTANITSSATISSMTTNAVTIGTTAGWLLTSPIQNVALSTNTIYADATYITSETVATSVISTITTNNLTVGSGGGWLLTSPLQTTVVSSIYAYANQPYFDTVNVGSVSTMNSLEFYGLFGNYNNTVLAEVSTGGGSQELLVFKGSSASDRVRVQTTGAFVVETGVSARLFNSNTTQTLSNATPAFIVNSSSNVGIQTASPGATLDVAGIARAITLSSQQLFVSSVNGITPLASSNITSTVQGLGTAGYLSTIPLILSTAAFFTSSLIASTATIFVLSTSVVTASTATINQVITSTVTTNGLTLNTVPSWIFTSPIQTLAVSTNTIWADQGYINTGVLTTGVISTMTTNALTLGVGGTWIQTAPIQTNVLSTMFLYANSPFFDTVNVGSVSTMNSMEFAGLFNAYNNTVLAEISTGGGSQELLVFKGSSISDRVRVQTTGAFVVETGVSSRLFNSNTLQTLSNATPAFVINTSSNVGIQTASPGATLDVAGTGRFQTLSSLAIFASSIVAPSVYAPQYFTF